ncbi:pyruvate/2-oxoacid:ferredoxin oxidoreductase beta subunit, partial [Fusobacterium sp. PH5-7]|nr:pyruvate/2-oxoacid:ferredoxin oxidoreductase beta subunit [Fusobacterium sp. PH5-7]
YEGEDLMEMCKLAVETCYWPLFEVIDGEWKLSYRPKVKLPVEEFLKKQGRFKHLFKPQNRHIIDRIQKDVDLKWERLLKRCGEEL